MNYFVNLFIVIVKLAYSYLALLSSSLYSNLIT